MRRTPRPIRFVLATLALLCPVGLAAGGDTDFAFEHLAEDQVLSQSSIHAFAQDRAGFLWIGTQYGVDRYDGFELLRYTQDPDDPNTLSNDFVLDLMVDRDGMLWIGTGGGLDRLDPDTGRITRYGLDTADGESRPMIDPDTLIQLPNGTIFATSRGRPLRAKGPGELEYVEVIDPHWEDHEGSASLALDQAGTPWLATDTGVWRFWPGIGRFEPVLRQPPPADHRHFGPHLISRGPGRTMAYAAGNALVLIDIDRDHRTRRIDLGDNAADENHLHAVAIDSGNHLWLARSDELLRIPPDLEQPWQRFPAPSVHSPGNPSRVASLFLEETAVGQIWLAGRFGVKRYDPLSAELTRFDHHPSNPRSLPATLGEMGYRIFMDRFGVLWVGGNLGGVVRRPPQRERFIHVRDSSPTRISRNVVRAIVEQPTPDGERVWVANQTHGITVWRRSGSRAYTIEHHYPGGEGDNQLRQVRHLALDPVDSRVWVAGYGGLLQARQPGAAFRAAALPIDPARMSGARRIVFLGPDRMALGMSDGTVHLLALDANRQPTWLHSIDADASASGFTELFNLMALDRQRLLAMGEGGLRVIDLQQGSTRTLRPLPDRPEAPANQVFSATLARDGTLWFGTRGGLGRVADLDAAQPVFEFFTRAHGLPDDTVYAILPDDDGWLWLSTNHGVARFRPADGSIRHYTPSDGVQAWEFNNTVGHVGASGRLYFGGINGWNVFRPGTVRDLLQPPVIQLKSVRVNGEPVPELAQGQALVLDHDRNQLSIDYVGLHFAAPRQVRYAYRLLGLHDDWIDAGTARQVQWASLPPGRYEFQLRAANLDGVWSSPSRLLTARIQPAPWNSVGARLGYLVAMVATLMLSLRYQSSQRRRLQALVERRTGELAAQKAVIEDQAVQLREALDARTLMFANVSHEFRTPLTLIRASIDTLERGPDGRAAQQGRRYINRMLRLVEQLLDISRLRLSEPRPSDHAWRLDSVVLQTVEAFRRVAEQRGQCLEGNAGGAWHTRCSREAVERILLNLIGNAVKFTPSGGKISVTLAPTPGGVLLSVADDGPGIPKDQHQLIFRRFYRMGTTPADPGGTGIGLALVREAVRVVGGRIWVENRRGRGARFQVVLPAERPGRSMPLRPVEVDRERQQLDLAELEEVRPGTTPPAHADGEARPATRRRQPRILVVEDNDDLRRHLEQLLSRPWRVATAANGIEGFETARRLLPDLIVTDLMMPEADGFELLRRLRLELVTSHIPVLFLTARQDQETRMQAYTLSADGFLAKPFDERELQIRIEQMLIQRQRLQAFLRHSRLERPVAGSSRPAEAADNKAATDSVAPRDRQLLEGFDDWLGRHYQDPDAGIEGMALALHMTPRTLQRKIKGLTGQTPAGCLRDYRLARARERLATEDLTITEIGLDCGFASSQYFSRVFRRQFGIAPDRWRRQARND